MNKVRRSNFYMHSLTSEFCLKWGVFIKAATGHKDNFSKLRIAQPEVNWWQYAIAKRKSKTSYWTYVPQFYFRNCLDNLLTLWLEVQCKSSKVCEAEKGANQSVTTSRAPSLAACWNVYKWSKKPHLKFTKKFPHHF